MQLFEYLISLELVDLILVLIKVIIIYFIFVVIFLWALSPFSAKAFYLKYIAKPSKTPRKFYVDQDPKKADVKPADTLIDQIEEAKQKRISDYQEVKVETLRKVASKLKIPKYKQMGKDELIEKIVDAEIEQAQEEAGEDLKPAVITEAPEPKNT
jgi:hypothetical protein